MASPASSIMGIGSNVVDVIYRVNQIAGPESKTYILPDDRGGVVQEIAGGVTLNHLAWARFLGVPTGLFGYQGGDRYGIFLRAAMDRHAVDRSHVIVRDGEATGCSIIFVDPDGERCIYMSRGPTGTTTPGHIDTDFSVPIKSAAIVTTEISQLPLSTVVAVLRSARDAGATTALDVDVPPDFAVDVARLGTRDQLEEAISLAHVVKPSKAAAAQLTDADTPERQAEALARRYNAQVLAITDGRAGSVLTDGSSTLRVPAHKIEATDTTGAGDAFFGGMVAGLLHDLPLDVTGRVANACAAACCTIYGAFPALDASGRLVLTLYGDDFPLPIEPDSPPPRDLSEHVGAQVLKREIAALESVSELADMDALDAAVELILDAQASGHRTHVCGVGKCRHISHKIAATLQSTGTPAYFLDPLDSTHGDSGQVLPGDVVIGISHSGRTRELIAAIETVKTNGARVIGITVTCPHFMCQFE